MTRDWEIVATCDGENVFKQWKGTNSEWWASWRYNQTKKHDSGTTSVHLCDHYKKYNQAYDCKMKMRVRRPEDSEKVEVETCGHCNHQKKDLRCARVELPSTAVIKNFVYRENAKDGLMNQMKMSDLHKYAQAHSAVPNDPDMHYAVSFEVSLDKKNWLMTW
uniref:Vitellogenin n=1 Tax=Ditylenchus dipsaci TaxID=166011 RepID=A0A915DUA4_9BILA